MGRKFEKYIKKLEPIEACVYLSIEGSHDLQYEIEKEMLKKEYLRGLRLVLGTE
jgi:hypothetical protein